MDFKGPHKPRSIEKPINQTWMGYHSYSRRVSIATASRQNCHPLIWAPPCLISTRRRHAEQKSSPGEGTMASWVLVRVGAEKPQVTQGPIVRDWLKTQRWWSGNTETSQVTFLFSVKSKIIHLFSWLWFESSTHFVFGYFLITLTHSQRHVNESTKKTDSWKCALSCYCSHSYTQYKELVLITLLLW